MNHADAEAQASPVLGVRDGSTSDDSRADEPRTDVARRHLSSGVLTLVALVALTFVALPLVALLRDVRWSHLAEDLSTSGARQALWLSARTTCCSTVLCALFGTPLAWWLSHLRGRRAAWLRAVVTVPLVLPPVVAGVGLLDAWGRVGLVGRFVTHLTGEPVPYSWVRVVMAETFVAMPFFVIAAEGAFRGLDPRWSRTAAVLGASPWTTLTRVLIPMTAPGLLAGLTLAWARAFGEFGATITFAGSFPGTTQTGPLAVYQALDVSQDAATALAALMLVLSVVVLALLRGHWVAGASRGISSNPPHRDAPAAAEASR